MEDPTQTWKQELTAYQESRTNWPGMPQRDPRVTHKDIKNMETKYNPITQKFTDNTTEVSLK